MFYRFFRSIINSFTYFFIKDDLLKSLPLFCPFSKLRARYSRENVFGYRHNHFFSRSSFRKISPLSLRGFLQELFGGIVKQIKKKNDYKLKECALFCFRWFCTCSQNVFILFSRVYCFRISKQRQLCVLNT